MLIEKYKRIYKKDNSIKENNNNNNDNTLNKNKHIFLTKNALTSPIQNKISNLNF